MIVFQYFTETKTNKDIEKQKPEVRRIYSPATSYTWFTKTNGTKE